MSYMFSSFQPTLCSFINLKKTWIIVLYFTLFIMFFKIEFQGKWLSMLRKIMDFTTLIQVSSNISNENQLYIYCPNSLPQIKTKFGFITFNLVILLNVLKAMFPLLFKNIDVDTFHYDVCEVAKHHHVSILLSNKRSSFPFALIHNDI